MPKWSLKLKHPPFLAQEKLIDEGICDALAPSVSSINRIVRKMAQPFNSGTGGNRWMDDHWCPVDDVDEWMDGCNK
jgi:hypothetical protein